MERTTTRKEVQCFPLPPRLNIYAAAEVSTLASVMSCSAAALAGMPFTLMILRFVPLSAEMLRGLAIVRPKREYLKAVENGDARLISYSASTPSIAPSPMAYSGMGGRCEDCFIDKICWGRHVSKVGLWALWVDSWNCLRFVWRGVFHHKAHGNARYAAQLCALDTRDQDG